MKIIEEDITHVQRLGAGGWFPRPSLAKLTPKVDGFFINNVYPVIWLAGWIILIALMCPNKFIKSPNYAIGKISNWRTRQQEQANERRISNLEQKPARDRKEFEESILRSK